MDNLGVFMKLKIQNQKHILNSKIRVLEVMQAPKRNGTFCWVTLDVFCVGLEKLHFDA